MEGGIFFKKEKASSLLYGSLGDFTFSSGCIKEQLAFVKGG